MEVTCPFPVVAVDPVGAMVVVTARDPVPLIILEEVDGPLPPPPPVVASVPVAEAMPVSLPPAGFEASLPVGLMVKMVKLGMGLSFGVGCGGLLKSRVLIPVSPSIKLPNRTA